MKKAFLYDAWGWDCDECGRQNFALAIYREFPDLKEKAALYRLSKGLDEDDELPEGWEEFDCLMFPDQVTCAHCHEDFETETEEESL